MLLAVTVIGVLLLAALVIVTFAAYKIDAESFEFTTAISRVVSISLKITSRHKRPKGGPLRPSAQRHPRVIDQGGNQDASTPIPQSAKRRVTAPYSSAVMPGLPPTMKSR